MQFHTLLSKCGIYIVVHMAQNRETHLHSNIPLATNINLKYISYQDLFSFQQLSSWMCRTGGSGTKDPPSWDLNVREDTQYLLP